MAPRLVYRIEHKRLKRWGRYPRGPFSSLPTPDRINTSQLDMWSLPTPGVENIFVSEAYELFGWFSFEAMGNWVTERDWSKLAALGFRLRAYMVPVGSVQSGRHQVAFNYDDAIRVHRPV